MANLAQQFMSEMTASGAWFLLLVPLFFLLVRYSVATLLSSKREQRMQAGLHLPPSPPSLPILGHLHLVGSLPHVSLRSLAAKHGADLMLLRLGAMPALVVTSPRAAEEVLRTHDHVFASRPCSLATDIILYGPSDLGFAPYGEYWRQAKKLVTTHLLSARKVRSFRLAREEESPPPSPTRSSLPRPRPWSPQSASGGAYPDVVVQLRSSPHVPSLSTIDLLEGKYLLLFVTLKLHMLILSQNVSIVMAKIGEAAAAGTAVDMSGLLGSFTNDLACRAMMGKHFRNKGLDMQLRELIGDTSPLIGGFNMEEFFPFLARFGVLSKVVRAKSERVKRRWDELLDGLIEEHESDYDSASARDPKDRDHFIHVLLSVRQEYGLTREQMKAILLVSKMSQLLKPDVFFAGIETTASTLDFAIAELMRRPDLMRKLQADVRSRIPEGRELVTEANLGDTTYLRAVVKETLRLHPVTPLLPPHFSMSSCSINGFEVPASVRVLINAWAIGRDARFWEDAEEFVPERFLDDGDAGGVDFKGNDFRFLPFGAGRRMCPGTNFAMASLEMMLANLVRRFDWELPPGEESRGIDMSEVFGLVVHRKKKLLLVPKLCV
ncbi:hypothetical protein EJB05_52781, partial [Eragrostis curvula]